MGFITYINNIYNNIPNITMEVFEVNTETIKPVESTINIVKQTVE
jgi:hypothetical protein